MELALNATANVSDSIRTITFDHSPLLELLVPPSASISPDFNRIAVAGAAVERSLGMNIYDMTTGKYLAGTKSVAYMTWFTPDGCEVWCRCSLDEVQGWAIVKEGESDSLKMECLGPARRRPEKSPWTPSRGHKITDDGWILNPNGKRLLWLPPRWRSDEVNRVWSGRFLAFLHYELPEAVILEVQE